MGATVSAAAGRIRASVTIRRSRFTTVSTMRSRCAFMSVPPYSSRAYPDIERVMRVEVLAHRSDLPLTERDQEMVLLSVLAAVSKIALRFDLDRHVVAFGEQAEDRHLKAAFVELSEHAAEEALQTVLVVDTGHWRQLGLPWHPPRHVVRHQREHPGDVAGAEAREELYRGALVVLGCHGALPKLPQVRQGTPGAWRRQNEPRGEGGSRTGMVEV